jgi:hypothetical protein
LPLRTLGFDGASLRRLSTSYAFHPKSFATSSTRDFARYPKSNIAKYEGESSEFSHAFGRSNGLKE